MTPPPSKRRRTDINAATGVTEEGIAKLPSLEPDILLAVFTHSSLARHEPTEEYSDNSRLAELGRIALDAAVSTILYQKKPLMSLEDIATQKKIVLSDTTLDVLASLYRFEEKIRMSPDVYDEMKKSSFQEATATVLRAYAGGVISQHGMDVLKRWFGKLVDPEYQDPKQLVSLEEATQDANSQSACPANSNQQGRKKKRNINVNGPAASQARTTTTHPAPAPIEFPSNPITPAQPSLPFLPVFSSQASQRGLTVTYQERRSGPDHAALWVVKCFVKGIEMGEGSAPTKLTAKEAAARQAWSNLGWAPIA